MYVEDPREKWGGENTSMESPDSDAVHLNRVLVEVAGPRSTNVEIGAP